MHSWQEFFCTFYNSRDLGELQKNENNVPGRSTQTKVIRIGEYAQKGIIIARTEIYWRFTSTKFSDNMMKKLKRKGK